MIASDVILTQAQFDAMLASPCSIASHQLGTRFIITPSVQPAIYAKLAYGPSPASIVKLNAATAEPFTYTQLTPATSWTIAHNLGRWPAVTVVDASGLQVTCGVQNVSTDVLLLTFNLALAGKAILV